LTPQRSFSTPGLIAAAAGPLLIVCLYFPWWGTPDSILRNLLVDTKPEALDGWYVFDYQEIVWLVTGVAGFAFGVAALAGSGPVSLLAGIAAILGLVSLVLVLAQVISPPNYLELISELGGESIEDETYDHDLTRQVGPWVALASSAAITGAAALGLRNSGSSNA
jgi:hypothetical protein